MTDQTAQHPAAPEHKHHGFPCLDPGECAMPGDTAPETDVSAGIPLGPRSEVWLTDAEDVLLAEWWVSEGGDHEDLALDGLSTVVERILRERLRVVEGERERLRAEVDVLRRGHQKVVRFGALDRARAESAEADREALRAGIEALADEWERRARQRGDTGPDTAAHAASELRAALLPGDGR